MCNLVGVVCHVDMYMFDVFTTNHRQFITNLEHRPGGKRPFEIVNHHFHFGKGEPPGIQGGVPLSVVFVGQLLRHITTNIHKS